MTARPWTVFVRDIGPTFTFATEAAAIRKAEQLLAVENYAEVLVYHRFEDLCTMHRSVYRFDRQAPVFERFASTEAGAGWQVCDRLGNIKAREGCDRCSCGCKYWENDVCVDCHRPITDFIQSWTPKS